MNDTEKSLAAINYNIGKMLSKAGLSGATLYYNRRKLMFSKKRIREELINKEDGLHSARMEIDFLRKAFDSRGERIRKLEIALQAFRHSQEQVTCASLAGTVIPVHQKNHLSEYMADIANKNESIKKDFFDSKETKRPKLLKPTLEGWHQFMTGDDNV